MFASHRLVLEENHPSKLNVQYFLSLRMLHVQNANLTHLNVTLGNFGQPNHLRMNENLFSLRNVFLLIFLKQTF